MSTTLSINNQKQESNSNELGEKRNTSNKSFSPNKYNDIKTLGVADIKKAALTLFEAFRADDLASMLTFSLVEDQNRRDEIELKLYESYVAQHILKGLCLGFGELEHKFETVAVWALPDSEDNGMESCATLMECGFYKVWLLCDDEARNRIFKGMMPLLHDTFEHLYETEPLLTGKNVYTLVYLGSVVEARGKGNSRKMFEYMFDTYIDTSADNVAYLESSSINNIPIYNKFGFHWLRDITLGNPTDGVAGVDYAVMNVMIRDSFGRDWTKSDELSSLSSVHSKGKL